MTEARTARVPEQGRGVRLDRFLVQTFPELSRARIQSLIAEGRVRLDGGVAKPAHRLSGGEEVVLELPEPRPVELTPESIPLRFLYEDVDLAVVDKPAGLVVHPAAGHASGTLVNALLFHWPELPGIGGEARPGIVHRLDKDTTGCMVVAKTETAMRGLRKAFESRAVEKIYLALVHGSPPDEARIETRYGRHPVHRKRFTGRVEDGKPAVTELWTRERFEGASRVEVKLHTGRTHQIRVHLSEQGFPLIGDAVYGRRKATGHVAEAKDALGRQALHAWKLGFPHPRTGKWIAAEAPLPGDFVRALEVLRAA